MQVSNSATYPPNNSQFDLEAILQSSADGFLAVDANFRITFANRRAAQIFALPASQVSGKLVTQLLPGVDTEALAREQEVASTALDGGVDLRAVCMAGGYGIWVRWNESNRVRELQQRATVLNEQSNAITNSMRSGLILVDGAGNGLKMNPVARKMFGIPDAPNIENQQPHFEIYDLAGNAIPRVDWPLQRALRGEASRDLDLVVRSLRSNPAETWTASFNTHCVYGDSGRLDYVVALVRDVSAVRETEQAFLESEKRHTEAMEAAHLGTWSWNVPRNELLWSERCRMLYGLPADAPITVERYRACVHPDDRKKAAASSEDCLQRPGELIEVEYRVCWPDGSVHWLQSWKQSRWDRQGRPELVTGVVVNIDDRKAVEGELHQTAGALRAIIDGSPIGIVATDAVGSVKTWNPAAERVLGFKLEEVMGKPWPLPIETGTPVHDREYRVRRSDGREIELLCSVAPIDDSERDIGERDMGEREDGSVAMFLDITERQRLRRRSEQTQKMESLSVLAGGVAHDFNNLLTGILGNASLCMYSTERDDENYELLQEILRAGDRAAALTRQLLAYTGQGRFSITPLNLGELARGIPFNTKLPGRRTPIPIQFDLDPRMPFVEADASQLQQVILSLIMNSAEAIDVDRPGTIWVRTRIEQVADGAVAGGDSGETLPFGSYAVLEVEDTGSGMDTQTLGRIFEPFFSTKFTGRGLGLPAVLGIVRQHRGVITAQSVLGSGSTFRIYLPLMHERHPAVAPQLPAQTRGAGRILVVDDEETVRTTIRRSLERWGYEVVLAENGQAAIDVFPDLAPQLRAVFLDLTMPVMGGEETLEHFRRIQPTVPVILISGYGEVHNGIASMPGKPSSFLQKPFTPEQLSQKLVEMLDAC